MAVSQILFIKTMHCFQNASGLLVKNYILSTVILTRTKSKSAAVPKNLGAPVELAYSSFQSTDSALDQPNPVVVLHGILGSKSNFNSICKQYHAKTNPKRKVFAIDLRNHGDSTQSDDHSYDDLVMDLIRFTERMSFKKICLLGHDMGGRVSMILALKYPELVEKLVISDISPITTSQNFLSTSQILRRLNSINIPPNLSLADARNFVAGNLSLVVKSKGLMNFLLLNLIQRLDGSFGWKFNLQTLLKHFNELSSFPEVHNVVYEGPALFVGGAKSDYIQRSDYPKIQKLFPNAELTYIHGAGHWIYTEKPQEFVKLTTDFFNRNVTTIKTAEVL